MSSRFVIAVLLVLLAPVPASTDEQEPIRRDARDVATLVARAHLTATASEDPEDQQLRMELVATQVLFRRALVDATQGGNSGALETLGAECQRLRPQVPMRAQAASGAASANWQQIGAALNELCAKRDDLAGADPASSRNTMAKALLERIERTYDPTVAPETPTIRLPTPIRARRR